MMAGIKGINTKPETYVRSVLHKLGFRFRLHVKNLPGKPDIVLPRYQAVVLVHGCFWHGHECHIFKWPSTRREFWVKKICDTRKRDLANITALHEAGWRVAVIWECGTRGASEQCEQLIGKLAKWIKGMKKTDFESIMKLNCEG
jgi:DNA mismatch endonuclease (patch repair protein)